MQYSSSCDDERANRARLSRLAPVLETVMIRLAEGNRSPGSRLRFRTASRDTLRDGTTRPAICSQRPSGVPPDGSAPQRACCRDEPEGQLSYGQRPIGPRVRHGSHGGAQRGSARGDRRDLYRANTRCRHVIAAGDTKYKPGISAPLPARPPSPGLTARGSQIGERQKGRKGRTNARQHFILDP